MVKFSFISSVCMALTLIPGQARFRDLFSFHAVVNNESGDLGGWSKKVVCVHACMCVCVCMHACVCACVCV